MDFALDPRLAADTAFIADWPLSRIVLMNDSRYPWVILVPRRMSAVEIFDLDVDDRAVLVEEVARAAEGLKAWAGAEKMNVAALGNIVRQLHVHVVARRPGDPAGAAPVWGVGAAIPYSDQDLTRLSSELAAAL
jgi:diadenosine tetraphosphate (Ap4A) HIT family hydrolase